jgi:ribonuclease P protein component
MISRSHRFHGHNSLSFVYRQGQTARGPQLLLKFAPNTRRKTYRVAVVVSRKVSKSAVVRNRIRRRVYEAVRLNEALIEQPYDLVFTALDAQLAEIKADELHQLVISLLKKMHQNAAAPASNSPNKG